MLFRGAEVDGDSTHMRGGSMSTKETEKMKQIQRPCTCSGVMAFLLAGTVGT